MAKEERTNERVQSIGKEAKDWWGWRNSGNRRIRESSFDSIGKDWGWQRKEKEVVSAVSAHAL